MKSTKLLISAGLLIFATNVLAQSNPFPNCDEEEIRLMKGWKIEEIRETCGGTASANEVVPKSDPFEAMGWTSLGIMDRFCKAELSCNGSIPLCTTNLRGTTIQDRTSHNGCIAQGCETGSQFSHPTYWCGQ